MEAIETEVEEKNVREEGKKMLHLMKELEEEGQEWMRQARGMPKTWEEMRTKIVAKWREEREGKKSYREKFRDKSQKDWKVPREGDHEEGIQTTSGSTQGVPGLE
jgi:hypothetical protein